MHRFDIVTNVYLMRDTSMEIDVMVLRSRAMKLKC